MIQENKVEKRKAYATRQRKIIKEPPPCFASSNASLLALVFVLRAFLRQDNNDWVQSPNPYGFPVPGTASYHLCFSDLLPVPGTGLIPFAADLHGFTDDLPGTALISVASDVCYRKYSPDICVFYIDLVRALL